MRHIGTNPREGVGLNRSSRQRDDTMRLNRRVLVDPVFAFGELELEPEF